MPDRERAIRRYRSLASGYDSSSRFVARLRRHAVEFLALRPGEVVLDVACGTGLMLGELARHVGPRGRVVGIEQSPEMIAIARERVKREGLDAVVTLTESSAEQARVEHVADAMLFFYTHDVLQSPLALEHMFAHARTGARVVVAGARFRPELWAAPLNLWVAWRGRRYRTTYAGLLRPWRELERHCPDFRPVRNYFLGTGYLGAGTFTSPANQP